MEQHNLVEYVETKDSRIIETLNEGVEDYTDLNSSLIAAGRKVKFFGEEEVSLEAAFMALTKGVGAKI